MLLGNTEGAGETIRVEDGALSLKSGTVKLQTLKYYHNLDDACAIRVRGGSVEVLGGSGVVSGSVSGVGKASGIKVEDGSLSVKSG